MKRWLCWIAAGLFLVLLTACGGPAEKEAEYRVYFRALEGEEALQAELRSLPSGTQPVEGLLALLLAGPESEGLERTIPANVTLRGTSLENGVLTVDFSSRYAGLSGIDLTMADYSVVQTLSQVDGVEAVTITAEGEPIPYRDHQRLTAEDVWLFEEK